MAFGYYFLTRGMDRSRCWDWIFLIYYASRKKKLQILTGLGLICFLIGILGYVLLSGSPYEMFVFSRGETMLWRLEIWQDVVRMIQERPLFGHGINTFMSIFQEYFPLAKHGPTYAHNCYLQIAAETGLFGLVTFSFIIARIFQSYFKNPRVLALEDETLKWISIGLISGIFGFLVHSFFDTHFYTLQHSSLFWYMVGLLVAISNINRGIPAEAGKH